MPTRLATDRDLDAVEALYAAVCVDMEGAPYDVEWRTGSYPTREGLAARIEASELLVIEDAGAIVGACVVDNADDPAYAVVPWGVDVPQSEVGVLHLVAVDPAHRGRGLAGALVEDAISLARERGFKALRLDVWTNNDAAVRLYERHGFVDRGVFTLAYGDGVVHDAHLMEYDLRR